MKERKYIVDTTLRDGEQSPFVQFTPEIKIQLARWLEELGVHQIEAGVVALGGQEESTLHTIIQNARYSEISLWSRLKPDEVKKALEYQPQVVHVSVPVSYLHIYTKLGKNKNWIVNQLLEILDLMAGSDCKLSIGFEDASRAELSFLLKLISLLEDHPKMKMIRLADTVGGCSPFLFGNVVKEVARHTAIPLGIHTHNDLGLAVPNTLEAFKGGALYGDTTLLGVGERSGNCDLEKLLLAGGSRFDFGIDGEALRWVQMELAHTLAFFSKDNKF